MKQRILLLKSVFMAGAVAALAVGLVAEPAFAQPNNTGGTQQGEPMRQRYSRPEARMPESSHYNRSMQHSGRERGAGPDHRFHQGDRLPKSYRSSQYVVEDWRSHRLSRPPRGHRWMQVGSDYVLMAVPTGIIAQIRFGG